MLTCGIPDCLRVFESTEDLVEHQLRHSTRTDGRPDSRFLHPEEGGTIEIDDEEDEEDQEDDQDDEEMHYDSECMHM